MEDPEDIFQWADSFWCFREEFADAHTMRAHDYRVVLKGSEEWRSIAYPPPPHRQAGS